MTFSGLDNDQAVILSTEVIVDFLNNRFSRILEVDGDHAAHRACHLVEKT